MLNTLKRQIYLIVVCMALLLALFIAASDTASADVVAISPGNNCVTFSSPSSFSVEASQLWDGTLYYSTNKSTWNTWDGSSVTSVAGSGNKYYLYFCGSGNTKITGTFYDCSWTITGTQVSASGNIETLLDYATVSQGGEISKNVYCYGSMFQNCTALISCPSLSSNLLSPSCYYLMFSGCTNLTTAPDLPATTLASQCYYSMFQGCSALTVAPNLPALIAKDNCYCGMFSNCTNLKAAPELPATTLAYACYSSMFESCSNLETTFDLPAAQLKEHCYSYMFRNCTNLKAAPDILATEAAPHSCFFMLANCSSITDAPILAPTKLAENCYLAMFMGCTSLKETPSLPATTLDKSCYDSMFSSCEALTTFTDFPATTLAENCCLGMFADCKSLNTIPSIFPVTNLAPFCYRSMFLNCTSLTTAPVLPATTLAASCYRQMFYGCSNLETAPTLPATSLAEYCYAEMFRECTKLESAPVLPATTLYKYCYNGMFRGCSKLETAPALPATTLAENCYNSMFYMCTGIDRMPALPATTLAKYCYYYMFYGSGVIVKTSPCPGYGKEFVITDTASHTSPTLYMFSETGSDVQTPVLGTTYYILNDDYNVSFETLSEGTISVTPVKKGKCVEGFTITVTPDLAYGYGIRTLYYTKDSDETHTKVYITLSDGVYSFVMPGNDITIGATVGEVIAIVEGQNYYSDNIQDGVDIAIAHKSVLTLCRDTNIGVTIGGLIFIDFDGHGWDTVATLDTTNVVGINAVSQLDLYLHNSLENFRNPANMNQATSGAPAQVQAWLDLDGDGYINESDVSIFRQKFESDTVAI